MSGKEYTPEQYSAISRKDRMYQGNRPIAYLDDLQALHNEIAHWLVGNQDKFGYNGYVPLLPDGTIDPKYIRAQIVGVDVYKDAQNIGQNCKTLVFKGTRVKVFKDDTGNIVVYIPKNQVYSHLGQQDGQLDGNMQLDSDSAAKLTTMICPIGSEDFYHGFTPGQKMTGFVATNTEKIVFKTKNPVVFKDAEKSKFVISLLDPLDRAIFTVQTARVTEDNTNLNSTVLMGSNKYVKIEIKDFQEQEYQYCANVYITVDLKQALAKSTGFKLSVTHYNDQNYNEDITTWVSDEYFYCFGDNIPSDDIDIYAKIYINSEFATPVVQRTSGIRYVMDGYVEFTLSNIKNLNSGAIYDGTRLLFETNISDEVYEFKASDLTYGEQLQLTLGAIAQWKAKFKIKKGILYPIDNITAKITVRNAYSEVTREFTNINIKHETQTAYIDTMENTKVTNKITQAFEGSVFGVANTNFMSLVPNIQNYQNLVNGTELQVIPNVGICYPEKFTNKIADSITRYFRCQFTGDDSDTSNVWGGTFIFGGLTLAQFKRADIGMRISLDDGATWYNLKNGKDCDDETIITYNGQQQVTQIVKGIFCQTDQLDDALAVRFAMPEYYHFKHTDMICFELTMKSTCDALIKYILLKNQDNTGDY